MLRIFLSLIAVCALLSSISCADAWAGDEIEPASTSQLTEINLPDGAVRLRAHSVPSEIRQALQKLVAECGPTIKQGESEVLTWTGKNYRTAKASRLIKEVAGGAQSAGWKYEVSAQNKELLFFSLLRDFPKKRGMIGFFVTGEDALVLAWTEITLASSLETKTNSVDSTNVVRQPANNSPSEVVLNVEQNTQHVNVMGNQMPSIPQFPALSLKAGTLQGYVKDSQGKALQGAYIGVRATAVGGFYSGANAETDANGFYSIQIPWGVADLYAAGYSIDYGDGRAGLSLHPVDGKTGSFASTEGAVKNFVLLPYGITSRDNLSENPQNAGTYYGGTIYIGYYASEPDDAGAPPSNIPLGSIIEIKLTPEGKLFDGSESRCFLIRKKVGNVGGLRINNIPVGRYKISAKLLSGGPLKMKLNQPRGTIFGMQPEEATGSASLLFYPDDAKASMVMAAYGNWKPVQISVSRP